MDLKRPGPIRQPLKAQLKETDPLMQQLWRRWFDTRQKEAKEDLILAYHPMVKRFAHRRAWSIGGECILDADDFISIGIQAVSQAIDKFDENRKTSFPTYAAMRIFGAFNDAIREVDFVPRLARKRMKTGEEQYINNVSMETVTCDNAGATRNRTIADGMADPKSDAGRDHVDAREMVLRMLKGLSRQFKAILYLYHGEGLTMKEIGKCLGVSESRISQLHVVAMNQVRAKIDRMREDGELSGNEIP